MIMINLYMDLIKILSIKNLLSIFLMMNNPRHLSYN